MLPLVITMGRSGSRKGNIFLNLPRYSVFLWQFNLYFCAISFGVFALFHSVFLRYFGQCFCFTRYTVPRLVRLRTIPSILARNWPNFVMPETPNDEPATCLMRWKMAVVDIYSPSAGSSHTSKHRRKYCSAGDSI